MKHRICLALLSLLWYGILSCNTHNSGSMKISNSQETYIDDFKAYKSDKLGMDSFSLNIKLSDELYFRFKRKENMELCPDSEWREKISLLVRYPFQMNDDNRTVTIHGGYLIRHDYYADSIFRKSLPEKISISIKYDGNMVISVRRQIGK
jgi:hypothetical protein